MKNEVRNILKVLKHEGKPTGLDKLKRYGINVENALGVPVPFLRNIAKSHKKNHLLSLELWNTEIHEARILASMIDDPKEVTKSQMNNWSNDFNSWDLCDQVCMNLFIKTPYVLEKITEYSKAKGEFKKRSAFAMISSYTTHNKNATEDIINSFFPIIEDAASDDRNFVKKAVS